MLSTFVLGSIVLFHAVTPRVVEKFENLFKDGWWSRLNTK